MITKKHLNHLSKDKRLAKVIRDHEVPERKKRKDLYLYLLRAIAGQQLSVKAAQTIWERFLTLFPDGYPEPKRLIRMDTEKLRKAGLSYQKAGYLKNIAKFRTEHGLDDSHISVMDDESVIDHLIQIKGVGRWTVEMVLMFSMCRDDVFPSGDLGIQQGMQRLYDIEYSDRKELLQKMGTIAEKWKPYRSIACMYIWKYKDS